MIEGYMKPFDGKSREKGGIILKICLQNALPDAYNLLNVSSLKDFCNKNLFM